MKLGEVIIGHVYKSKSTNYILIEVTGTLKGIRPKIQGKVINKTQFPDDNYICSNFPLSDLGEEASQEEYQEFLQRQRLNKLAEDCRFTNGSDQG